MTRRFMPVCALVLAAYPLTASAVALKNFREIAAFYAAATGVSLADPNVKQVYQEVKARLSLHGTVDEYSAPLVLATVELGGSFCKAFITAEAALPAVSRRAHQSIDFGKAPSAVADADLMRTATNYANLFWGRDPAGPEVTSLGGSLTTLKKVATADAAGTQQLLLGLCTEVAASLDALIYQ